MMRSLELSIIAAILVGLGTACATKSFVNRRLDETEGRLADQVGSTERRISDQVRSTESRLTEQVTTSETTLARRARQQEAQLRDAAQRAQADRQAIDAVGQTAGDAKSAADAAASAVRDAEARLAQRIADRNRYRLLETRSVYFPPGGADIRREDVAAVEEIARALKEDANAVLELQGFADPTGSDRLNYQLARERVDAVIRTLVMSHGIELRQLRAAAMGKTALGVDTKTPTTDPWAAARRVDLRLLTPWSSWEDRQGRSDGGDQAGAASPPTAVAPPRASPPAIAPGDLLGREPWREIINSITPQELGARWAP